MYNNNNNTTYNILYSKYCADAHTHSCRNNNDASVASRKFCGREVEQDMVIKGYRIPKGTPLMLPPHAMQLCPDNFSRPNKFWPDRWTSGVLEDWDPKGSGLDLHLALSPCTFTWCTP